MWKRYRDTNTYANELGEIKRIYDNGREKILSQYKMTKLHGDTNYYVKINGKDRKVKNVVWEAFNGEIPNGYGVINKKFYLTINNLENLQLLSAKEIGCISGKRHKKVRFVINEDTGEKYKGASEASKKLFLNSATIRDYCDGKIKNPLYNLKWSKEYIYGEN